jgi:uncharacterized protein
MLSSLLSGFPDLTTAAFVIAGALAAGFVTGFAGFGTGLVASGFWFHVLPPVFIPPMVVAASLVGQTVGLIGVKPRFDWPRAVPYLVGGALGVPLGVLALNWASPGVIRFSIGAFLVAYAVSQLSGLMRLSIGAWVGQKGDAAVGVGGGILGGFAGLSGPLPLIWLQLRGGPSVDQRAVYQPFNIVVQVMAGAGMTMAGNFGGGVLYTVVLAVPATMLGAWLGARLYRRASEEAFRRIVLALLLLSGAILVAQSLW